MYQREIIFLITPIHALQYTSDGAGKKHPYFYCITSPATLSMVGLHLSCLARQKRARFSLLKTSPSNRGLGVLGTHKLLHESLLPQALPSEISHQERGRGLPGVFEGGWSWDFHCWGNVSGSSGCFMCVLPIHPSYTLLVTMPLLVIESKAEKHIHSQAESCVLSLWVDMHTFPEATCSPCFQRVKTTASRPHLLDSRIIFGLRLFRHLLQG